MTKKLLLSLLMAANAIRMDRKELFDVPVMDTNPSVAKTMQENGSHDDSSTPSSDHSSHDDSHSDSSEADLLLKKQGDKPSTDSDSSSEDTNLPTSNVLSAQNAFRGKIIKSDGILDGSDSDVSGFVQPTVYNAILSGQGEGTMSHHDAVVGERQRLSQPEQGEVGKGGDDQGRETQKTYEHDVEDASKLDGDAHDDEAPTGIAALIQENDQYSQILAMINGAIETQQENVEKYHNGTLPDNESSDDKVGLYNSQDATYAAALASGGAAFIQMSNMYSMMEGAIQTQQDNVLAYHNHTLPARKPSDTVGVAGNKKDSLYRADMAGSGVGLVQKDTPTEDNLIIKSGAVEHNNSPTSMDFLELHGGDPTKEEDNEADAGSHDSSSQAAGTDGTEKMDDSEGSSNVPNPKPKLVHLHFGAPVAALEAGCNENTGCTGSFVEAEDPQMNGFESAQITATAIAKGNQIMKAEDSDICSGAGCVLLITKVHHVCKAGKYKVSNETDSELEEMINKYAESCKHDTCQPTDEDGSVPDSCAELAYYIAADAAMQSFNSARNHHVTDAQIDQLENMPGPNTHSSSDQAEKSTDDEDADAPSRHSGGVIEGDDANHAPVL